MKKDKDKVKNLLKEAGVSEEDLNIAVDRTFNLANIFFDKWLSHQKQIYEKRKV
jgi:hypothetical protein